MAGNTPEFLKFFQQFEHQGAAGEIDPKVLLQPDSGLYPFDRDKGKTPFLRGATFRGENPLFDHVVDKLSVDAAEPTEIREGAASVFIQDHTLDVDSLLGHIRFPVRREG